MTRFLSILILAASLSTAAVAQAQTVIDLWSTRAPNPDNARGLALKHVLDEFEAQHNVKINVTVLDWKEISTALLRASMANQVPDIAMLYSPFLRAHIAAGTLEPLEDRLDEKMKEEVIVLPVARIEDHIYAMPWELRITGYIYRKDEFEAVGYPHPKTHDELIEALRQIEKTYGNGSYGVSFDPVRSYGALEWVMPMMIGLGAKIINDDGTAAFNHPGVIEVMNSLKALVEEGVIRSNEMFMSGDEKSQRFDAGLIAMFNDGSQQLGASRESSGLGNKVSFATVPDWKEGIATPAMMQGYNLVIPKGSKHPELAWELIRHWTSAEMQADQVQQAGYLPVNKLVMNDPKFAGPEFDYMHRAFAAIDRKVLDFNWPENSELLNDVMARMIGEVMTGRATPQEAIAKAESTYNSHLK